MSSAPSRSSSDPVALAVDLLRRVPAISTTTVALVFLLIVLAMATFARLRVAVLTSVVSMLAFNFFFIQPVGSFLVADPQNWIVLVVFLTVAVVASQLSASAQERARARAPSSVPARASRARTVQETRLSTPVVPCRPSSSCYRTPASCSVQRRIRAAAG